MTKSSWGACAQAVFLSSLASLAACDPDGASQDPTAGSTAKTGGSMVMATGGGTVASGGNAATGGSSVTGGSSNTGGVISTGGVLSTGGTKQTGGSPATGGVSTTGGVVATGGVVGTGGAGRTGGNAATGGAVSVDAGVKDTGSASADTAALVSFSQQIQPLMNSKCISCHGATSPKMGIRLNTYDNVKANAKTSAKEITAGAMPPTGGLATADRQLFQAWVNQGMLNN